MGLSIDQAKLEELQKFSAFFEFIANPQACKDLLDQVNVTLKDMQTTINAHTTVENAEAYLKAATDKIAEVNRYVDAENAKLAAAAKAFADKTAAMTATLVTRETRATAAENNLALVQAALKKAQTELDVAAAAVEARARALSDRETQMKEQEQNLQQKKAQLTALLG